VTRFMLNTNTSPQKHIANKEELTKDEISRMAKIVHKAITEAGQSLYMWYFYFLHVELFRSSLMQTKEMKSPTPLEGAIALHLATTTSTPTIGEPIQHIVESVRKTLGNKLISASDVRAVIESWVSRQWVALTKNYVKMTDIGKHQIASIANSAA
jgi:hypothetical protein